MNPHLNELVLGFLDRHRVTRLAVFYESDAAQAEVERGYDEALVCLVAGVKDRAPKDSDTPGETGITIEAGPEDFCRL